MKTKCPRCSEKLEIDDANAGLNVTCPTCQHEFQCPKVEKEKVPPQKPEPTINLTEKKLKEITRILYVGLIAFPLLGGTFSFLSVLPQRYEYMVTATPDVDLFNDLKTMGDNGWEMITARRATLDDTLDSMAYEIIWKRPK